MATGARPSADNGDCSHFLGGQSAKDRVDDDSQLRHLGWLTELRQTGIGMWSAHLSEPPHIGGCLNRAGPNHAEDDDDMLGGIRKRSLEQIREMKAAGAI